MSVRSFIEFGFQVGANNSLAEGSLIGDVSFTQLIDTLAKARSVTGALDAEELVQIDFGDIESAKIIYIEADGDLDFYLGGSAPTTAAVTAVGAVYPMAFAGGETLSLEIDGVAFTPAFLAGDTSLTNVINRINGAAAYAGLDGLVASNSGGQLRLTSLTTGASSIVSVIGGTARAALGLTIADTTGAAPTANTSPTRLRRPADPAGTQIETLGVMALLVATTTALHISNPSETEAVAYRIMLVGDLAPDTSC